jgi:hypothetical protein
VTADDIEQPLRDMDSEIGVDADQVSIESHVVGFGQRQAIRDHRLFEALVCIDEDAGGIDQSRLGQMRDRAPSPMRAG